MLELEGNFILVNVNDYAKLNVFTWEEIKKVSWASKIVKKNNELIYYGMVLKPKKFIQEYFKHIIPEKWKNNIKI